MTFPLNWITTNISTSYAPKSYDDLESIKEQGIDAIINLCGEYSDLHTIEEDYGFEVYWLPIDDERAPGMEEMEEGLNWLDEVAYLGKKVLIHCNLGIGRTGTFLTAYFLRRGFTLRKTEKFLKNIAASPTNFSQWRLLRKFGKKEGKLEVKEPSIDNRNRFDLSSFLNEYVKIAERAEELARIPGEDKEEPLCPFDDKRGSAPLQVIEAVALSDKINTSLSAKKRAEVIEKSSHASRSKDCPLKEEGRCLLYTSRPLMCRLHKDHGKTEEMRALHEEVEKLSQELFTAFFGDLEDRKPPETPLLSVTSGKFLQQYFDFLLSRQRNGDGT